MQKRRQKISRRRWIPTLQSRRKAAEEIPGWRKRESRNGCLFLLPSLIGTGGFVLFLFLDVVRRSFFKAAGSGFVGLENFRRVLDNGAFRLAVGNTVRFLAVCLPVLLTLSLLLAVLICRMKRVQRWIKTGVLLPMAVPTASVVVFFQMVFDRKGWLNEMLKFFGGTGKDWLMENTAFWVLTVCYVWKNLGYDIILWLAGLSGISKEQYDAAKVQGAGEWACFWYITLPQLKETAFVAGVLSFVNALRVFREAYLLAGDYPHKSIYMLQHLFNNWFVSLDIQKMTAAAVMLVIVTTGMLIFCERHWRNRNYEKRKR